MPRKHNPRHGSMQFWPHRRARRQYAAIRSWPSRSSAKAIGFAGYKVGMAHVIVTDNRPNSPTKGMDIPYPVTVLECPPLRVIGVILHQPSRASGFVFAPKLEPVLSRRIRLPTSASHSLDSANDFTDLRLLVATQPHLTGIGKKRPEVFEIAMGGTKEQKIEYAKKVLGTTLAVSDIFSEGEVVDVHGVTKGKGTQGPVARFGIKIRHHKSEKTKRGPGTLGGWVAQQHFMYRVPMAGKAGYNLRTEYNKWILRVAAKPEDINPKGGFRHYGVVKNPYVLVKGGVMGPQKRLITLVSAIRPDHRIPKTAPAIIAVVNS